MSYRVGKPIIHDLGFQGEKFFLKIVFPVHLVYPNHEDDNDFCEPEYHSPPAKRGVILKFKTEDLPAHSYRDPLVHFDLGQAIRDKWNYQS